MMEMHYLPLLGALSTWLGQANLLSPILLYLGPETIMPLGSFLAAVLGILLVFWRQATMFLRSVCRKLLGRKADYPSHLDSEGPGQGQRSPGAD
jgi:predicted membrane protein